MDQKDCSEMLIIDKVMNSPDPEADCLDCMFADTINSDRILIQKLAQLASAFPMRMFFLRTYFTPAERAFYPNPTEQGSFDHVMREYSQQSSKLLIVTNESLTLPFGAERHLGADELLSNSCKYYQDCR
jgi:hypothetical protein